jgi:sugar O-acyltransferase (sialic acid O-acetyltransferase NeuD family)
MSDILLYGVGSPIVAEYEETCRRLGWSVVAAIHNIDGECHFSDPAKVVRAADLRPALLAHPCWCPLFTPANRHAATREAVAHRFRFDAPMIDPTAIVARTSTIGPGSFVNAGAIVGALASLERHVVLNRGATIGHHVEIGAFASVGPGVVLGGQVSIGPGALIGAGAVVLPKVRIGAHAVVGAGAVVVEPVPDGAKVVGSPAGIIARGLPSFDVADVGGRVTR